jgi:AcrR family transcriptional regulator
MAGSTTKRHKTKAAARRTRSNGRATMQKLMKFGGEELSRTGALGFNVERVLRKAKVSTSSLVHHFGNRDGFIAALEYERAHLNMMREIDMLRSFILSTDDPDAIFKAYQFALSLSGDALGRERRRQRIESLAVAGRNPGLLQLLTEFQRDGTAQYVEVLRLAMDKRGDSPPFPIEGVAYVMQSLLVGRILVDLMDDDDLGKAWESAALGAVRAILSSR